MPTITYAVTAFNETKDLRRLLRKLEAKIRPEDQILIQFDEGSPRETTRVAHDFKSRGVVNIDIIEFPLNNDFASFKNNLFQYSKGEYIFQIDADEYPEDSLVENLSDILDTASEIDLLAVPRINTVYNITQTHLYEWGWSINEEGFINWPDYQTRVYRNAAGIRWEGVVHERIVGHDKYAALPKTKAWALHHPKTIERQEKQNEYYDKLSK